MRGAAGTLATTLLALAPALALTPAASEPLDTGGSACGGNAYSSAEVTEGRGRRRGPLTALPETLCADIETGQPPVRIELYGIPGRDGSGIPSRDGSASGLGGRDRGAPYERSFRRGAGPSDD